mmetsp:Transcript_22407/g.38283  ORF Transcript_22407/g.38283 Transcript_22407/m.38283 type:complete len:206 (-) Transcript_22407:600-1217(-)
MSDDEGACLRITHCCCCSACSVGSASSASSASSSGSRAILLSCVISSAPPAACFALSSSICRSAFCTFFSFFSFSPTSSADCSWRTMSPPSRPRPMSSPSRRGAALPGWYSGGRSRAAAQTMLPLASTSVPSGRQSRGSCTCQSRFEPGVRTGYLSHRGLRSWVRKVPWTDETACSHSCACSIWLKRSAGHVDSTSTMPTMQPWP